MNLSSEQPVGLKDWIEYFEQKLRDAESALDSASDVNMQRMLLQQIEETRFKLSVLRIDIYAWAAANAIRLGLR